MNRKDIMLSKVSQIEKDKSCVISLTCGNLTKNKDEQTKQKQIHKYKEEICGYQRRKGLGTGNMSITGQLYGDGW